VHLVAAVRTQILTHSATVQDVILRQSRLVGAAIYNRKMLEKLVAKGTQLDVNVVGLCMFNKDVTRNWRRRPFAHSRCAELSAQVPK
jgi:hypothetical protein